MGYQRAAATVQVRELQKGFRDRVHAELSPKAAAAIADTQAYLDAGQPPLTPTERATYEHRIERYRRPAPQDELPFGPEVA